MKKVLWVGDGPDCPSGFGRATREIVERLLPIYQVTVLGLNHRGDPGTVPYPVYAAAPGGDVYGVGRLIWMCDLVKPDVIVIQNDGWFIPYYIQKLRERKSNGEYRFPEHAAIPVVAAVAVDGKNFKGEWIKDVSLAIFWTQFALNEARFGGYTGEAKIISLGVDQDVYYPGEKRAALERQKISVLDGKFIVGNVNRNQPRKRWDLTIKYFAEWVHSHGIKDAILFLHAAPTGDESVSVMDLARYYDVSQYLALREPETFYGSPEEVMRDTYNCFDVCITTTQGEGMGLTTLEAMACQKPCIAPDAAALGDWAKRAAMLIPCSSTALQSSGLSVIGSIPDQGPFIEALDLLYRDKTHRELVGRLGFERVSESRFRWQTIGEQWLEALNKLLTPKIEVEGQIWQELKV